MTSSSRLPVLPAPRVGTASTASSADGGDPTTRATPQVTPLTSPAAVVAGVQVRWTQGRPVVVLTGDIDLASSSQITSVGRFLRRWNHPACVDAAEVGFIDVAGLRAVLALAGASGAVEVRYPSWALLRLLQLLGGAGVGVHVSRALGAYPALVLHQTPALS